MDSRVAGLVTNPANETSFNLRPNDNYIIDTNFNRNEYNGIYFPLVQAEAAWLDDLGVTFMDADPVVTGPQAWRPSDVEMAL